MAFPCEQLQVASEAAKGKAEWSAAVSQLAVHTFDSSLRCDPASSLPTTGPSGEKVWSNSNEYTGLIFFAVVFLILAPLYLLVVAAREVVIDFAGLLCKAALVLISKQYMFASEWAAAVAAAVVVSLHMLAFLAFKGSQIRGSHRQVQKMERLNWVDLWMHLTLCLTAYLALSLTPPSEKLSAETVSGTCVAMLVVNSLYLVFWLFQVIRLSVKHLAMT